MLVDQEAHHPCKIILKNALLKWNEKLTRPSFGARRE
jgi:hypothetical protein